MYVRRARTPRRIDENVKERSKRYEDVTVAVDVAGEQKEVVLAVVWARTNGELKGDQEEQEAEPD